MAAARTSSVLQSLFILLHVLFAFSESGLLGKRLNHTIPGCPVECVCESDLEVICDGRKKRLTYIPSVPITTTSLIFRNNDLTILFGDSLQNITNGPRIKHLDLSSNGITEISNMAFSHLRDMESLDLSDNLLSLPDGLQKALVGLKHIHLQKLTLRNMGINEDSIPPNLFEPFTILNSIRTIDMSRNRLSEFDVRWLTNLTAMEELILSQNELVVFLGMNVQLSLPGLKKLDLRSNSLTEIPLVCPNRLVIFPNLTTLLLEDNFITNFYSDELSCLLELVELSVGQNPVNFIPSNLISALPKIKILRLNYMLRVPMQVSSLAFASSSLEILSLAGNELATSLLIMKTFSTLERLERLDLAGNEFTSLENFKPNEICEFFPTNLKYLSLRNCHLQSVPRFKHTSLQELDISDNCILKLAKEDFSEFPNLTVLNVNSNRITRLNDDTFPLEFRDRLIAVGASENPLICSCALSWFKEWIEKEPLKFLTEGPQGVCIKFETSETMFIVDYQENCSYHRRNVILIAGVVSGTVVLCVVGFLLYYYRRNVSFFCYMSTRRREGDQLVLDNETNTTI